MEHEGFEEGELEQEELEDEQEDQESLTDDGFGIEAPVEEEEGANLDSSLPPNQPEDFAQKNQVHKP